MSYYLEDHPNTTGPAQYGWPRTWASGVIGVHTTESGVVFEGADPGAENTARFISGRADYGSYHIIADWDTIVPMTRPTFAAWADTTNNVHALSVSGAMNAARWRDLAPARAAQIVRNMGIAAAMLARDAVAHGVLQQVPPAQRITAAEAIAGTRAGFYGHGETNPGTRYDPGTNFDWDLFLATYAAAVGGDITYQSTEEDAMSADMPMVSKDGNNVTLQEVLNSIDTKVDGLPKFDAQVREQFDLQRALERDLRADLAQKGAQIDGLTAAVTALAQHEAGVSTEDVLAAIETAAAKFAAGYKLTLQPVEQEAGE